MFAAVFAFLFSIDLGEFSLDRLRKEQEISSLIDKFSKAKASFLVNFKGINVEQVTSLRKGLVNSGAEMKVIRNTLAKVSLKGDSDKFAMLEEHFVGPNALVFAYEDVPKIAKILCEFQEELESLKLKVGLMDGQKLDSDKIVYLSKLPSLDELRAKFLSVLGAVQSKFLRQLKAPQSSFVRLLRAKENQT